MMNLAWRKSSYSDNSHCVEVAELPDGSRLVRDTKLGQDCPLLQYTAAEWQAFIAGVKANEFD